ncbi:MAG: hypothetical protein ACYS4W_14335 [Planctomycetota bacterium]|jgi:hypothetical protein
MAESTLNLTFTEIRTEIGRFLGLDRTYANWTASEILDVTACIKRGLRNFYFPPRSTPTEIAHRWSFLRPQSQLVIWDDVVADDAITVSTAVYAAPSTTITASGAVFYPSMEGKSLAFDENSNTYVIASYTSSTVVVVTGDASGESGNTITVDSEDSFALPWDYGGMSGEGLFTYDNADNKLSTVTLTSEANIRHLRQSGIDTGTPYLAAIVPLTTAGTEGQRWAAIFHNPPNEVLTLHYRYYLLPDALVLTSLEYPYGSTAHSETILESCLAIAESREKDGGTGEHQNRFAALLQSSIDHDRGIGTPIVNFGYNRDGSDGEEFDYHYRRHHHHHNSGVVATFNA